jgi:hypothetical protein
MFALKPAGQSQYSPSVKQNSYPEKIKPFDTPSGALIVTLLVTACIVALGFTFCCWNIFGLASAVGLIAMAVVSGALALSSLTAIVYLAIRGCAQPTQGALLDNCSRRRIVVLPDQTELIIYPTEPDGSCGFHALLGDPAEGMFRTNAKKAREEFCNWIRGKREQDALPCEIGALLEEFFLKFDEFARPEFKQYPGVRELYHKYHTDYDNLPIKDPEEKKKVQEARKAAFVKEVFEAYLNTLQDTKVYLYQDELIVAAKFFDKKIVLYQPEWNKEVGKVRKTYKIASAVFNEQATDCRIIWFNGHNHYEGALLKTKNQ